MDALDGNAIGGLLHEVFGTEMTAAIGTCAACGTAGRAGTSASSTCTRRAPSSAAAAALAVLMVIVRVRDMNCVDLRGLAALTTG